jgi:hypothetical protein
MEVMEDKARSCAGRAFWDDTAVQFWRADVRKRTGLNLEARLYLPLLGQDGILVGSAPKPGVLDRNSNKPETLTL